MFAISPMVFFAVMHAAAPLVTQQAPPVASEHRLDAAQIEAVLAEAARKRETADRDNPPHRPKDAPQLRGEVGMSIGSGGHRGAFGTVLLPLSDDSAATLSVDYTDPKKRRHR